MTCLLILAVIATYTIPKVLTSMQRSQDKARGKEVAAMIAEAYQMYKLKNGGVAPGNIGAGALYPYMNHLRIDTNSQQVDSYYGASTTTCTSNAQCLVLHNGGKLRANVTRSFGGTQTTNAIWFQYDPDGKVTDGTINGPGKAVEFNLYYNGLLRTASSCLPNTCDSMQCWSCDGAEDPPWFSWD